LKRKQVFLATTGRKLYLAAIVSVPAHYLIPIKFSSQSLYQPEFCKPEGHKMNLLQSRNRKIKTTATLFFLFIAGLLLPGLPWSAYCQHKLKKIVIKTETMISKWQGSQPRLLSIVGVSDLPGARVQALYSPSGWATFCDSKGQFRLSDVLWYPGITYELIISTNEVTGRIVQVNAPLTYPSLGIMDVGNLQIRSGQEVTFDGLQGDTSYSHENFDWQNRDYYREIYDGITLGMKPDELKVKAVNNYVSERLNYKETEWELGSPRRIIEQGSQYCGHLADTMASLLARDYLVRVVHLKDDSTPANTHVVVEVFYEDSWHLYDPTFGIVFRNVNGKVASYRELCMNPELVSVEVFSRYKQKYPHIALNYIPDIYTSGHHHFYYMNYDANQYAHAWWAYKGGVLYVSTGDSVLLAAAGIRAGSNVTYHIRKPGSKNDELIFSSVRGAGSNNVLNEEESPPIQLTPGLYEVYADFYDGNTLGADNDTVGLVKNCHLKVKLEVK
jgi:hypothetical protein